MSVIYECDVCGEQERSKAWHRVGGWQPPRGWQENNADVVCSIECVAKFDARRSESVERMKILSLATVPLSDEGEEEDEKPAPG